MVHSAWRKTVKIHFIRAAIINVCYKMNETHAFCKRTLPLFGTAVLTAFSQNLMYNVYSTLRVIYHKFAESATVHKGTIGDAFDSCSMGQNIEKRKIIVSYVLLGSSIMAPRHYGSHTIIAAKTMTF